MTDLEREALEMLEGLEWIMPTLGRFECPRCYGVEPQSETVLTKGHAPDCKLDDLIKRLRGKM